MEKLVYLLSPISSFIDHSIQECCFLFLPNNVFFLFNALFKTYQ